MRSTRSEIKGSRFPLKVGMSPMPSWTRRAPAPAPGPGERVRRSELIDLDALKREELARGNSEQGES